MTMQIKRILSAGFTILLAAAMLGNVSCHSNKVACHAYGDYKVKKKKRNHTTTAPAYGYQTRPVKKAYVIKNKSK